MHLHNLANRRILKTNIDIEILKQIWLILILKSFRGSKNSQNYTTWVLDAQYLIFENW